MEPTYNAMTGRWEFPQQLAGSNVISDPTSGTRLAVGPGTVTPAVQRQVTQNPSVFNRTELNRDVTPNTGSNLQTGLAGIQAASGLLNAYTGLQGLGLAKDQFGFQKAAANRNIANQAALLNEQRANAGNVGLALAGSTMSAAQKQAARDKITAGNVDGSKVG